MLWHPLFAFSSGEAVAPPAAVDPAIWGAVADYFYRNERRIAKARKPDELEREEEEVRELARAEIARISAQAEAEGRARDLDQIAKRVGREALAFRDFYRREIEDRLAEILAREADRETAARIAREESEAAALRIARGRQEEALILMAIL